MLCFLFFLFTGDSLLKIKLIDFTYIVNAWSITEGLKPGDPTEAHPVQCSALGRISWSRTHRAVFSQVFSMSRDGQHWATLCQYSVTHTIEEDFPNVQTESPVFEFVPIAFYSLPEHKLRRPWLHHLCTLSWGIYIYWSNSLWDLLQADQSQLSQPFLLRKILQSLQNFYVPLLDSPTCPHLFCTEECGTGHWTSSVASPGEGGHWGPQPFTWPLSPMPTYRNPLFSQDFLSLPA